VLRKLRRTQQAAQEAAWRLALSLVSLGLATGRRFPDTLPQCQVEPPAEPSASTRGGTGTSNRAPLTRAEHDAARAKTAANI
jgi:hypothetical protein